MKFTGGRATFLHTQPMLKPQLACNFLRRQMSFVLLWSSPFVTQSFPAYTCLPKECTCFPQACKVLGSVRTCCACCVCSNRFIIHRRLSSGPGLSKLPQPGVKVVCSQVAPSQEVSGSFSIEQRLAIETPASCVRVVAGPGSGKTRVLTHRIVHLIQQYRVSPADILCITFTNKAADELRERLDQLLGSKISKRLTVGTFHSFCARLLRWKPNSGIDNNFAIYDEDDCEKLLKNIVQLGCSIINDEVDIRRIPHTWNSSLHTPTKYIESGIDSALVNYDSIMTAHKEASNGSEKLNGLLNELVKLGFCEKGSAESMLLLRCLKYSDNDEKGQCSNGKKLENKVLSGEVKLLLAFIMKARTHVMKSFIANKRHMTPPRVPRLLTPEHIKMAHLYEFALRENNAVDFDDIINLAVRMLHQDHAFRLVCQEKWKYVLVDEFQDTDVVQYELVHLLAKKHQNLFVVGDIDQAIYGWRGAESMHMQNSLINDFPSLATFQLQNNYRSSENILRAASVTLHHSRYERRMGSLQALRLLPTKADVAPIVIGAFETCDDEAKFVLSEISNLVRKQLASWGSFAVMYRTRIQSFSFETVFTKARVPYIIAGATPFYSHKEIKIMMCYLHLIANLDNEVALEYCINTPPRGIGDKTLTQLKRWALSNNLSLPQALERIYEESTTMKDLGIRANARDAVLQFVHLIKLLSRFSFETSVVEIIQELIERLKFKVYLETLDEDKSSTRKRLERLEQLVWNAQGYHQVGNFLEDLTLVASQEGKEVGNDDTIKLITMHASKGMEFQCVFITGASDGILPLVGADEDEERRLFYVGVTRAEERLYLTYHQKSWQFSTTKPLPSRFMREIFRSRPSNDFTVYSSVDEQDIEGLLYK